MIPGIILAGGESSRMGQPKALLPTDVVGETFLLRLITTLRQGGVDDVIVVTGPDRSILENSIASNELLARFVSNPNPSEGQISSLLVGLSVADRPGVRGALVTLVDVPLVSPETVVALLASYRQTGAPIVRPGDDDRHGHPVVFDRSLFDELRGVDKSQGAKAVVRAHQDAIIHVSVNDEGAFTDIDTPTDYERIFGRKPA
jgi:molybdenum cofactor cytidylyltransferase